MTHQTETTPTPGAAPSLRTGIAGVSVALWYATPDFIHGRRPRALAKTAIIGGAAVAFARGPARSSTQTLADNQEEEQQTTPSAPTPSGTRDRLRKTDPRLLIGVGTSILIAGIGLNIATERWIHRFGNRLARKGTLLPHTAIGLVAGSLTVLASLDDFSARPEA